MPPDALGLALAALVAAAPVLPGIPVAHHRPVPAAPVDGWRPAELSGLAWHGAAGELMAVSDRGRWLRWRLKLAPGRIAALEPVAAGRLGPARVNAEAVTLGAGPDGGRLWLVADEATHQVLRLDADARPLGVRALPPGLGRSARANRGVEALAWHPRHGLIAALQRPEAGHHHLHGDDGLVCRVPVVSGGRSTLKDMHRLDERELMLLEKQDTAQGHRTLLRRVDLARCGERPATWVLDSSGLPPGLNFEGLACVDHRRCLLVSDDAGQAGQGVLALVEWP